MVPMVAQVAAQEPQMAPKPAQAATLAAARLPGTRESHLLAQSNSAPDNPARNAKLPIMMNNGITIME